MKNIRRLLFTASLMLVTSFSLFNYSVQATEKHKKIESSTSTEDLKSTESAEIIKESDDEEKDKSDIVKENDYDDEKEEKKNEDTIKSEKSAVTVTPHWEKINSKLYYVTDEGIVKEKGWFNEKDINKDSENDNDYYLSEDYSAVVGWQKINGLWYCFNEKGEKQTGWQVSNYKWYHLNKDGVMDNGWIKVDRSQYYLEDGVLCIGKKYIDNKWYFFGDDGSLKKGFYTYKGKEYFSDSSGVMAANRWIETKKNKYYVKADSSLAKGDIIIDGDLEKFDQDGRYQEEGYIKDYLYVNHLNVGNADCAFIKFPSGETALIDTGDVKTSDYLVDFLNQQRLREKDGKPLIDYIIITHAHSDHIGGLAEVVKNFAVNKVYIPKDAKMKNWHSKLKVSDKVTQEEIEMIQLDYDVYKEAVDAMKENGLKFTNVKSGEFVDKDKLLQFVESDKDIGKVKSKDYVKAYWGLNDNSAITYLNYGDYQSLFTGDMQWIAEKNFWTNNLLNNKAVDVLKVPHHGNDTSSTADFLNYIKAPIGIVSSEEIHENVAYGNLLSSGVSLYNTGKTENNGVSIFATKDNWNLTTEKWELDDEN